MVDTDNLYMAMRLLGVFIAALVVIWGFEFLAEGVAEGTIALEVVVFVVLVLVLGGIVWWTRQAGGDE